MCICLHPRCGSLSAQCVVLIRLLVILVIRLLSNDQLVVSLQSIINQTPIKTYSDTWQLVIILLSDSYQTPIIRKINLNPFGKINDKGTDNT